MRRILGALVVVIGICGVVMGDEQRGNIVKIDSDSITVRAGGFFGGKGKGGEEPEEKTYKISGDVKITRVAGKDKEPTKLTLDELKTAVKVTNVMVTVVHEDGAVKEIKVGFGGAGKGGKGKFGKKDKKKEEKKDD